MNVKDWSKIKYFDSKEFDSPDQPFSGKLMKEKFILKLDETRSLADTPFKINSGYRSAEHNRKIGGASKSSHLSGWAADIRVRNNKERRIILNALISAGLDRRVGIADTFIHVDDDPSKSESYWTYSNKSSSLIKSIFKNNTEDI